MTYLEQAVEAETRLRRGDRQLFCDVCGFWVWSEECQHTGRLTQYEFEAMMERKLTMSAIENAEGEKVTKCGPFEGTVFCNQCPSCHEHIAVRLHDARRLLFVHGAISDSDNDKIRRRILKVINGKGPRK